MGLVYSSNDCIYSLFHVDCGYWTTWNSWSDCSVTCGHGSRIKHRQCIYDDRTRKTKYCVGSKVTHRYCYRGKCLGNQVSSRTWQTANGESQTTLQATRHIDTSHYTKPVSISTPTRGIGSTSGNTFQTNVAERASSQASHKPIDISLSTELQKQINTKTVIYVVTRTRANTSSLPRTEAGNKLTATQSTSKVTNMSVATQLSTASTPRSPSDSRSGQTYEGNTIWCS